MSIEVDMRQVEPVSSWLVSFERNYSPLFAVSYFILLLMQQRLRNNISSFQDAAFPSNMGLFFVSHWCKDEYTDAVLSLLYA